MNRRSLLKLIPAVFAAPLALLAGKKAVEAGSEKNIWHPSKNGHSVRMGNGLSVNYDKVYQFHPNQTVVLPTNGTINGLSVMRGDVITIDKDGEVSIT